MEASRPVGCRLAARNPIFETARFRNIAHFSPMFAFFGGITPADDQFASHRGHRNPGAGAGVTVLGHNTSYRMLRSAP